MNIFKMKFFKWLDAIVKRLTWVDVHCIEWAALFFGLLIAKLFPQVLGLEWYWYLIIMLAFSIKPMKKMFK
jgi:hypothetical protein